MATETTNAYTYNVAHRLREELCPPQVLTFAHDMWNNFKSFAYKDDDVIVCTFPRSGTHMSWMLVRYLLQGNMEPIKDAMEDSHLPQMKPNDNQKGRRIFNTHFVPANFGDSFFMNGKHKFIHVSRNPKDTLVSYFYVLLSMRSFLLNIPDNWEEFLPFILTTDVDQMNWFMHTRGWEEFMEKNPEAPVLDLKFEEILKQPETAIKKMADFLEVPLSDKFLQDLVDASKFENMKNAPKSEELENLIGAEAKDIKYYRKGKIGDWVNTFTVAQNELFEATYEEQMKGSKVKNIYH